MTSLIIAIHIIVCALLIGIILIQRGRGSGLVESFSGVESMFGTKTSAFLARTTTILSVLFFVTCLSLALLSAKKSRSLMKDFKAPEAQESASAVQVEIPKTEETKETVKEGEGQPAQPQPSEGTQNTE
jgi:preprotein translocase subunit SecG